MALVLRTTLDLASLTPAVRAAVREVDPEQPLYEVRPMTEVVAHSLQGPWLSSRLLGAFAGLALLLASAGVYGVVSFLTEARRREFGVRLAVGADAGAIVRLVLGQGLGRVGAGLLLGLAVSAALGRVLTAMLHGVSALDVPTYIAAAAVMFGATLAASALPAWRASRTDPALALRLE
jgi:ABC-type antimicrobial peptide transport system permease subunit